MTFCNIAKSYVRNNTFLAVKGEVFGIAANYFLDLKKYKNIIFVKFCSEIKVKASKESWASTLFKSLLTALVD